MAAEQSASPLAGQRLGLGNGERLVVKDVIKDSDGSTHVRYNRTFNGLRVIGGDLVSHRDSTGAVKSVSWNSSGKVAVASMTPKVGLASVKTTGAQRASSLQETTSATKGEMVVYADGATPRLAYDVLTEGMQADQTPSRLHTVVDANTGAVLQTWDEIETGTGHGIHVGAVTLGTSAGATIGAGFSMRDLVGNTTTDLRGSTSGFAAGTIFTDADDIWGNGLATDRASAAVDAQYGAGKTFEYYKTIQARNGIWDTGVGARSRVHFGTAYVNAFWDGSQMTYGDGSGNARPLVALDVAGHEMSHGVTENVVPGGLAYSGESGGLNEATSDIFGSMVEFYANSTADAGDYDIGEKININGNGTPLRYMYNPTLDGSSHGCWSTTTKNVDVHYSSGVANHFFFDLAEGSGVTPYGTSPLCGPAEPVTGIGRDKAAAIWFRALDAYFVSSTTYAAARGYTLSAAADLYGFCSTEYKAVRAAWTAVNVAGDDICSTGNDFALTLSSSTAAADPGTSATLTATTALVNGEAEAITFAAGTTPAGVTVSFEPATITAGESTTVTVSVAAGAGRSTAPVTITATAASITRSAALTVSVNSAPGCTGTNGTDVAIPDNTTVQSSIALTDCATTPSTASTVEVHIVHTYIGDLVVSLIAPDGTAYVLHNRAGGSTDNIDQTYTVNLAGEAPNGTWTLRVQDAASIDTGYLDSWTLSL